jgi:hypothetical protein
MIGFLTRRPWTYSDLLVHCGLTLCIRSTKCSNSLLHSSPTIFNPSLHFSSRECFCPPSTRLRPEPGAPPTILSFAPLFRPASPNDCAAALFRQPTVQLRSCHSFVCTPFLPLFRPAPLHNCVTALFYKTTVQLRSCHSFVCTFLSPNSAKQLCSSQLDGSLLCTLHPFSTW